MDLAKYVFHFIYCNWKNAVTTQYRSTTKKEQPPKTFEEPPAIPLCRVEGGTFAGCRAERLYGLPLLSTIIAGALQPLFFVEV